jgi:hypothetical protein
LGDLLIVRTDCVKNLGVMLGSKLHFHRHIQYKHSKALKLLGLIHFITYNFSSLDSLKVLCITLILTKLEYASVVWNILSLADSSKLENIKRKFANFAIIELFSPTAFVIMNLCWIIYILKCFIPGDKILTLYFALTFKDQNWLLFCYGFCWAPYSH